MNIESDITLDELDMQALYGDIVGHVPEEISDRITVGMRADPKMTRMFEELRRHLFQSENLEPKVIQLLLFGMMAAKLAGPPVRYHAVAAKLAGATEEELYAVAGLSLLAGGMRSFNTAGAAIAEAFDHQSTQSNR